jgi:DNA-binding protein HU-beta
MTKAELIDAVRGDMPRRLASQLVHAVFSAVEDSLLNDGRFSYPGFGTFVVKPRAARAGKNPQTGETIQIPAGKTVVFKPAPNLKEQL